ncbi:MAG: hypothetical protein EU981_01665 [Candidatus Liberibacter ctenarytainae]|uniref:Rad50/SbcC-type AAA domain-containing protein n=1 Tax=Candidatus Liberibacter ctenarytainae TaxID=2020335 RepID=A0A937AJE5_9HYPH|nr:hypothetical protein [Candidatus Liberibacter ctenarytainae]
MKFQKMNTPLCLKKNLRNYSSRMAMLKLIDIQISHFRGFVTEAPQPINLRGDLAIFYGPNGFGKSSLSEAIEWLFYGYTKRRKREEIFNPSEYKKSYANVQGGTPVKVTATIAFSDGTKHTITRQMEGSNENSITLVDEKQDDFKSIGIQPLEDCYPVIAQNELKSFIHTKQKDRHGKISAILGLEELASLKTVLQKVKKSLDQKKPSVVSTELDKLQTPIDILGKQQKITPDLYERWSKGDFNYHDDWAEIIKISHGLLDEKVSTKAELIKSFSVKLQESKKAIFDNNKLNFGSETDKDLFQFKQRCSQISTNLKTLNKPIKLVLAAQISAFTAEILEFWGKGLHLARASFKCPMCEELTLTQKKRDELEKRIRNNAEVKQNHDKLKSTCNTVSEFIHALSTQGKPYILKQLSDVDIQFLKKLPPENGLCQQFFDAFNQHITAGTEFQMAIDAAADFVKQLPTAIANSAQAKESVKNCATTIANLTVASEKYEETIFNYRPIKESFSQTISSHIASSESVRVIEALQKIVEHEDSIKLLTKYKKSYQDIKTLASDSEEYLNKVQVMLFKTHEEEVGDWYNILNPGAKVCFDTMKPTMGKVELIAKSFGKEMSAAANLSECQLNCLGLAVWMMRATSKQSSFGFIVFDDPIQSMDDTHTESFIKKVIPKLIDDHNKQVIVLSHTTKFTNRLNKLYDSSLYHFTDYGSQGPKLIPATSLNNDIQKIKDLNEGSEDDRKSAHRELRLLIEKFIHKLYFVKNKKLLPPKYNMATANKLLEVFNEIEGTTEKHYLILKDTVQFSNKAHHYGLDYSAPHKEAIETHIDDLEKIIKYYSLLHTV